MQSFPRCGSYPRCLLGLCRLDYLLWEHLADLRLLELLLPLAGAGKTRVDGVGCVFKELGPVIFLDYSAMVAVPHGLEFYAHFDKVVVICSILVRKLYFLSTVVCLLVEIFLLQCFGAQILRFWTREKFIGE